MSMLRIIQLLHALKLWGAYLANDCMALVQLRKVNMTFAGKGRSLPKSILVPCVPHGDLQH